MNARVPNLAREQLLLNAFDRDERIRTYRAKLEDADWTFQLADDARIQREGVREFATLLDLQEELDPTGAIWNSIRPDTPHAPMPRVELSMAVAIEISRRLWGSK